MNAWKVPAAEWFRKLRAVMVDAPSDFPERLPTIQNATWAITLLEGMVESPPDAQPREPTPSPVATREDDGSMDCSCGRVTLDFFTGTHSKLTEEVYQRHGPGEWVLVQKGPGFA